MSNMARYEIKSLPFWIGIYWMGEKSKVNRGSLSLDLTYQIKTLKG